MKALLGLALLAGLGAAWWSGALSGLGVPAPRGEAAPAAAVYQWKDRQGNLHFGDAPPAGTGAKTVDLKPLTVVQMPKAPPAPPARPAAAGAQEPAVDEDGVPIVPPSRRLRNPALERMGLTD